MYIEQNFSLEEAISLASSECIKEDILKDYLLTHETEVAKHMKLEWTMEDVQEEHERVVNELKNERDLLLFERNSIMHKLNNLTTALQTEGYSPDFINKILNEIHS